MAFEWSRSASMSLNVEWTKRRMVVGGCQFPSGGKWSWGWWGNNNPASKGNGTSSSNGNGATIASGYIHQRGGSAFRWRATQ